MLEQFYQDFGTHVCISREQGSRFAKAVADDFNPLHDVEAKKFCVPGDLLFSVVLDKYGINEQMHFTFANMVDEGVKLSMPQGEAQFDIKDGDKCYLSVQREGENSQCKTLTNALIKNYVEFSGKAFPHVVVPLMAKQGVMINPARPMIIYESMSIHMDTLVVTAPELREAEHVFTYEGKRGKIILRFDLLAQGEVVGRGEKHMLVSGIREYCQDTVDELIRGYNERKAALKP
ncbi:hypothetical protein W04_3069 [Pseudoalteromonas sp. SW0106-04]|uniref:DUF3581 family protein n=1 Tax=Pseudoalteromonas sp. SW0106-04 TaxID=1702169 RepID=UPI0006B5D095|nr:DUF3581 family protein [Pseudoalteromonas sp. SW0106-04]GAP76516.1 hypothetical protein W04_3069 [Pseudoalteromonas sp. SW0106-04]